GGLWATACELAFAGGVGVDLDVDEVAALFTEELGAVVAVPADRVDEALAVMTVHGLADLTRRVGTSTARRRVRIPGLGLDEPLADLARAWDEVSWRIARLRDNPECADAEHAAIGADEPLLTVDTTFDPTDDV